MRNKKKNETINELYGSVQDTHNYGETYYYQQAKETAAVTAIAMIRDGVPWRYYGSSSQMMNLLTLKSKPDLKFISQDSMIL